MIAYSSGLRVSEVVHLKHHDLDKSRKILFVSSGKGTDIRFIQELLGHSSIRTTERYTHVACHKISNILSPIDTIQGI